MPKKNKQLKADVRVPDSLPGNIRLSRERMGFSVDSRSNDALQDEVATPMVYNSTEETVRGPVAKLSTASDIEGSAKGTRPGESQTLAYATLTTSLFIDIFHPLDICMLFEPISIIHNRSCFVSPG